MDARQRCPNCGSEVESLAFCGVCGHALPNASAERDDSPRGRLNAATARVRARPLLSVLVAAGMIIFLLLLGGQAGLAILVALMLIPYLLLSWLTRLDLYEREPWALLGCVVGAGALLGLLGGWLSSLIFERFWFTDTRLNLGAVGFAGVSANGEGSVPFGVLLLNGILVPVLVGAFVLGGPVLLRRWAMFRNEVLDGMTLGGLAAAGFGTLSGFVYFWPSVFDSLPDRPVGEWTAILAGIVVLRPIVLILAGSLLGIAAWQYASSKDVRPVLVTGIVGVFGWLALPLGSLVLARSGAVAEFIWYLVALLVVGPFFREALNQGLARDRAVLAPADGERRVVCPNCRRVTPDGTYCSFCRAPLHERQPAALGTAQLEEAAIPSGAGPAVAPPVMNHAASQRPDARPVDPDQTPAPEDDSFAASRSFGDLLDEPEADPLDHLPDETEIPADDRVVTPNEQPGEPPRPSDSGGYLLGDDRSAQDIAGVDADDVDDSRALSKEPEDADALPFPANESADADFPVSPEGAAPPYPVDPHPFRPRDAESGTGSDEAAVSGSPWSNVRPFRSAAVSDPQRAATRKAWLPGGTSDFGGTDSSSSPNEHLPPSEAATTAESTSNGDLDDDVRSVSPTAGTPDTVGIPRRNDVAVVSSSARWFDTSSGRMSESDVTPLSTTSGEGEYPGLPTTEDRQHRDAADSGDVPSTGQVFEVPEPPVTSSFSDPKIFVPTLARQLRNDPQDNEGADGQPVSPDGNGQEDWSSSEPTSGGSAEPDLSAVDVAQEPAVSDEAGQRPGIWRHLTRQVRPASPRSTRRESPIDDTGGRGPSPKDGEGQR